MPTAQDIAQQKRQADEQKRQAYRAAQKQKELLRQQLSDYDRQIAQLQTLRSHAAADLSSLG